MDNNNHNNNTGIHKTKAWIAVIVLLVCGIAAGVGLCLGVASNAYHYNDERRALVGLMAATLVSVMGATALVMRVWHHHHHRPIGSRPSNHQQPMVPLVAWLALVAGGLSITALLLHLMIISVRHEFEERGMDPKSSSVAIQWYVYLIFGLSPLLWTMAAWVDHNYYYYGDDNNDGRNNEAVFTLLSHADGGSIPIGPCLD